MIMASKLLDMRSYPRTALWLILAILGLWLFPDNLCGAVCPWILVFAAYGFDIPAQPAQRRLVIAAAVLASFAYAVEPQMIARIAMSLSLYNYITYWRRIALSDWVSIACIVLALISIWR